MLFMAGLRVSSNYSIEEERIVKMRIGIAGEEEGGGVVDGFKVGGRGGELGEY